MLDTALSKCYGNVKAFQRYIVGLLDVIFTKKSIIKLWYVGNHNTTEGCSWGSLMRWSWNWECVKCMCFSSSFKMSGGLSVWCLLKGVEQVTDTTKWTRKVKHQAKKKRSKEFWLSWPLVAIISSVELSLFSGEIVIQQWREWPSPV